MNRRAFVARLAAAAALAPVASKVIQAPGPLVLPEVKALPGIDHDHRLANINAQSPVIAAISRADRSFSLLRSRGLVAPCPNCKVDAWKVIERDEVICERCGWLDKLVRFEGLCLCPDCIWRREAHRALARNFANNVWPPAMRSRLLDDAPIGFYAVVDRLQREVRRIERNVYDLNTDGWLHNVQQRQLARVLCGVYALNNPKDRSGIEQVQRPNGDVVFFHWENVDCYEWQRDREQRA